MIAMEMPRPASASNRRASFRQRVDHPITIRAGKVSVNTVLVDISETGCRLRSQAEVPVDTHVSFSYEYEDGKRLELFGRVRTRTKITASLYDYGVSFASLPVLTIQKLRNEIMRLQRRDAVAAQASRASVLEKGAPHLRVTVGFPLRFSHGTIGNGGAFASEISVDNLVVWTNVAMMTGAKLHMNFVLPAEKAGMPQSAFRELRVKGIVASRPPVQSQYFAHVVTLTDLHPDDREVIARYVHAFQVEQLRLRAETEKRTA